MAPNCSVAGAVGVLGQGQGVILEAFSAQNPTPCPGLPAGPATGGTKVSPFQLASAFWDVVPLPVPQPSVPPGKAITGTESYLVTGDTEAPPPWVIATPIGTLTVTAHGTYLVNWGDGTGLTGPYATTGAPWPTGTITHVYDTAATVTIEVEEEWTATWSLGGAGGTLAGLTTVGTLPGFDVGQVQAVVTGGGA